MKRFLIVMIAAASLSTEVLGAEIPGLPQATPDEQAMYAEIKGNASEVAIFIATRKYVRQWEANKTSPGAMPPNFAFKYCVDIGEQVAMFQVMAKQGVQSKFG